MSRTELHTYRKEPEFSGSFLWADLGRKRPVYGIYDGNYPIKTAKFAINDAGGRDRGEKWRQDVYW